MESHVRVSIPHAFASSVNMAWQKLLRKRLTEMPCPSPSGGGRRFGAKTLITLMGIAELGAALNE
jgi:hypothetical protein